MLQKRLEQCQWGSPTYSSTRGSAWREYEVELYYDAISGELMIKELVGAAREVEMEMFKKHGVYEKVSMECWAETGKVRWGSSGSMPTRAIRRNRSTDVGWS